MVKPPIDFCIIFVKILLMSQINTNSVGNIAGEAYKEEYRFVFDPALGFNLAFGELNQKMTELKERVEKLEQQQSHVVAIQNFNSDKLELKSPLVVTIESTSQGGFVFWSEDLNTWGEGESEEEAKKDFLLSLEELYFGLKQDKDKLGPALERVWIFLQRMLKEV